MYWFRLVKYRLDFTKAENKNQGHLKKIVRFLSPASRKNKSPGRPIKLFFTLLKLNITFDFKCYLHNN